MWAILLSLFLIFSFSQLLLAQEVPDTTHVRLRGSVVDENQEPIPMVVVRIEGQGIATTANVDGKYNIQFRPADSVVVVYQMIGFQKRTRVLKKPKGELVLNIVMKSTDRQLDDVEVVELRRQMSQTQTLNTEEMKRLPSTTGNAVEELVATQAGVSTHNELSSQYNVRGGSFDENCVYINGVEVYRPLLISSGQQEGLSVINSDMVERVDFSAGGFEAKYGDKMSSVLDITYRKPRGWEGSLQGSLLGANAYAGYGTKRFSFSNGLRYKTNQYMLGAWRRRASTVPTSSTTRPISRGRRRRTGRWTSSATSQATTTASSPRTARRRFGTMEDVKSFQVYFDGKEEDLFRTLYGTAKLTRRLNARSALSLSFSAFHTKERETYDIQGQYWLDDAIVGSQLAVGTYMEHARNLLTSSTQTLKLEYDLRRRGHTMLAGLSWSHDRIWENSREWESRDSSGYSIPHTGRDLMLIYNLKSVNEISTNHMEMYLQDTWRKEVSMGILSVNYGARLSYWSWNSEWLFSPRVSMGYVPEKNDNFTFRLATGLYYQRPFYKELRDTITTQGNTRVRLNRDIRSQRSFQLLGAMEYKFRILKRPFKFSTEVYYKAQGNIIPYNVDNVKIVYYGNNMANGLRGRHRLQALRRIRARHRLVGQLRPDESLDEPERESHPAAHRPALQHQPLLLRLLPGHHTMEDEPEGLLCRRTALRTATYRLGAQRLPCASLQAFRHRHELPRPQQRRPPPAPQCRPEHLARARLLQHLWLQQHLRPLLGHRHLEPPVRRAQLPDGPHDKRPHPHRVLK